VLVDLLADHAVALPPVSVRLAADMVAGLRGGGKLPPGTKPPPPSTRGIRLNNASGIPSLLLGDLLKPVNLVVLRNNALLEAVVIAAAVIVDADYRRLRRARRAVPVVSPGRPIDEAGGR
jgi:hypothetical protein